MSHILESPPIYNDPLLRAAIGLEPLPRRLHRLQSQASGLLQSLAMTDAQCVAWCEHHGMTCIPWDSHAYVRQPRVA